MFLLFLIYVMRIIAVEKSLAKAADSAGRPTDFFDNFYEVTSKSPESFGALKQCADDTSEKRHICVPYHHCDPDTRTISQTGTFDGYGIIEIR